MKVSDVQELMTMWSKDSTIDLTNLKQAVAENSSLHAKYLNIHTTYSLLAKKVNSDFARKKIFWMSYYSGDFNDDKDFLTKHSLEPVTRKLKSDIQVYLDGNDELVQLLLKKNVYDEISNYAAEVVRQLRNRSYELKSLIDYEKFLEGN